MGIRKLLHSGSVVGWSGVMMRNTEFELRTQNKKGRCNTVSEVKSPFHHGVVFSGTAK